ncbi:MAG: hypothetical protein JW862_16340, partial [Anaerolineales bacterium]|nr:hypothetical protein [Anaerolineales bacterium]
GYDAIGLESDTGEFDKLYGSDIRGHSFPYLQLVVLNGCTMGKKPDDQNSLTKNFLDAGAQTIVAFNEFTKTGYASMWGDFFWHYMAQPDPYARNDSTFGMTVVHAANLASRDANNIWWYGMICDKDRDDCIFDGQIVVYGDRDLRLELKNNPNTGGGK